MLTNGKEREDGTLDVTGRSAIVTGGASGIGAAAATMLAERGYNVVINYSRSAAEAEETAAACVKLGADALCCRADVATDGDCRRMAAAAIERWGRIDVLINSAGTTKRVKHEDLEGLDAADFQRIYAVNAIGPFQMIRAVAPHMRKAGKGAVVNISAGAGFHGGGSSIAYAASKAALNAMTKSLARVLAPEIRVNAICPGLVESRWMRNLLGEETYSEHVARARERFPLRRTNTPADVAETALWLIEHAATMTGELINMDAGEHLR
jgi:3-oxoacyl-[acyl-carrier protein] reductase